MDDNIHKGHRCRMKAKYRQNGLDALEDHEVLELLLYYAIPYKNTNEIAHELLNGFRSLSGVFDADYQELIRKEGVGENTATLLTLIPELARRYSIDKEQPQEVFVSNEQIGRYLINHYIGKQREHVELLLFDSRMRMIDHMTIHEGSLASSDINSEKVAELIFFNRAANYVIAHNHPGGNAEPSAEDLAVTTMIYKTITPLNRYMVDHFIIADGKYERILHRALAEMNCN